MSDPFAALLHALENNPSREDLESVAAQLRGAERDCRHSARLAREARRALERMLGNEAREPRLRVV